MRKVLCGFINVELFSAKYGNSFLGGYKSSYFLFCIETTIYEHKTEDKPNRSNQTPGNMKITDTILVISVGSLLCAMLIFVIIREFCLCCRLPQPVGRRKTRDDVYADIAEMQNERTLTD